jgi:hypothetical protein
VIDAINVESRLKIKSYHEGGIFKIDFCKENNNLVSVSCGKFFSIQISDWKTG